MMVMITMMMSLLSGAMARNNNIPRGHKKGELISIAWHPTRRQIGAQQRMKRKGNNEMLT